MSTERTKRKVRGKDADETVSSGVPSGTRVGLGGQPKGKKQTAQVPVWTDNSVPRGIGVPPAKPPKPKPS